MSAPIIHFDYDGSPYGQKTKLLLEAAGVPFVKCDQPVILPRPDLEALGITYRRIPLLAVGKDVYADSSLMIDVIASRLMAAGALETGARDKAFEAWGNAAFVEMLGLLKIDQLPAAFVRDRATIFPLVTRKDIATLRPSVVAGLRARMAQAEGFLAATSDAEPFMGGARVSLADVHWIWSIRWGLTALGAAQEKGCGKRNFPKLWRAIGALPASKPEVWVAEKVHETIRGAEYWSTEATTIMADDPLGLAAGTLISVESTE